MPVAGKVAVVTANMQIEWKSGAGNGACASPVTGTRFRSSAALPFNPGLLK
jgi:hypothetical protein